MLRAGSKVVDMPYIKSKSALNVKQKKIPPDSKTKKSLSKNK
jgi:hypothetical protein